MSDLEEALVFQLKAAGLPEPIREYRFAPPRRWRFDLAWPELHIAVEAEGGVWVQGHVVRPGRFEQATEKYNEALCHGWFVLRVTARQISDGRALAWTERLIRASQVGKVLAKALAEPVRGQP